MKTDIYLNEFEALEADAKNHIIIKGARVHNLKNVNVAIPRNKLVVITGVSGSGKSSLTIDTLYAEGQRRYVESLSSYARQFLTRMDKPDVDYIKGISPAIAIEQKVITRTSRSTVGSLTEIYEYLRLLFARIGKTYSPVSGEEVKKHSVTDVVQYVMLLPNESKVQILIPFKPLNTSTLKQELELLMQKGYSRIKAGKDLFRIDEALTDDKTLDNILNEKEIFLLIDRVVVKQGDEDLEKRIADSVQTAFFESHGDCIIEQIGKKKLHYFNNRFEVDGLKFEEPNQHFFNFNSPFGACKTCEGFGSVLGVDLDLVIPDKNLSVYEGAIAPWRSDKMKEWGDVLIKNALKFDFPIHRSYKFLTEEEQQVLWAGNEHFAGLNDFFAYIEEKSYKIQYRVMLSRYRGRTTCPDCKGSRIRKDSQYVKISGKHISELLLLPISEVYDFFQNIKLTEYDQKVAKRILIEINTRLQLMMDVGLSYLSLNRLSNTLSGGESQRISLTRSLGSNLTDSLYILDEPSIGLHPRDTTRLIKVLKQLRDLGNTVVVVEHEEEIIRAADYLIDIGPKAGRLGGEVVYMGDAKKIDKDTKSLTAQYLTGKEMIVVPSLRRKPVSFIELKGATQHNLKEVSIKVPLKALTVVSGVSGSGKTTLIKKIFYPALQKELGEFGDKPGNFDSISGDLRMVQQVELIDQNPIGKSSRSNPVTYIKAYDAIRDLYAAQHASKLKGLQPKHFSFNVEGGRCETCKGEGTITVEMQFLADIVLTCEECKGKRFKDDILEVNYNERNISEVLDMTIDESLEFFQAKKDIFERLKPLQDVGLGYIKLGQSSSTLSGGEAQRVKLASYLGKGGVSHPVLFIFDEPTTGLHFYDIKILLSAFNALIEKGHTVLVIEHNIDVIKSADWVIDLGPEGGDKGGYLLYQGEPDGLVNIKESYTGQFLQGKV
jgi:excinuclease ABC subunit A